MAEILITVNGEEKKIEDSATLAELASGLGLRTDRIAAELNGDIVPKSKYDTTELKDGDSVELVNFVGGG